MYKVNVSLSESEIKQIINGNIHITLKEKMIEKLEKLKKRKEKNSGQKKLY